MDYLKTVLAMIGLVLIGFFAGFFTHQRMTMVRVKEIASIGLKEGFQRHLLSVIDAADDEEQKQVLVPIIQQYAEKIEEIHHASRMERRNTIEAMHEELKLHLEPEQIEKLEKFKHRFRGRPRLPHDLHGERRVKLRKERREGKNEN